MVPGFNTDFKYRGETYHVQTEDNGVGNPVVVTLLYHKGAILASRRTPYHDIVGTSTFQQELVGLMKSQHKDIMRALLAGTYDKNGAAPVIAGGSGEHPADAAAAIAGTMSKTETKPLPEHVLIAPLRVTPVATVAPLRIMVPDTAAMTLDEAIRHYLKEFAATAAATVH
jgi:hypothetical protein